MVASSLVFAGCKKEGCMDSKATNYDAEAKKDDGSCVFPEPPIVEPAVDTEKPKVSITKPAASAKVMAGSDLEMEATITDNEGVVSWDYKIVNGATEVGPTSATVTSAASVTGTATYSVPQDWPAGTATITITGTDAAGNVVFATTAEGGQAIWSGNKITGGRAKSGVYLVFASNDDGKETFVTKVLLIN